MKYDTRVQAWRDRLVDCNTHVCERKWLTKSRSLRIFCWKPQLFKAFNTTVQGRLLRRSHQPIFVLLFVVSLSSVFWRSCKRTCIVIAVVFFPSSEFSSQRTDYNLTFFFFFQNLDNSWQWVKGLSTGGSTNTLAALKLALADPQCHAIYLLTDGRPDQVTFS